MRERPLVVVDTNTMVRAFSDFQSPSGVVVKLCEAGRQRMALSKAVLGEYRKVLCYPRIVQRAGMISWNETRSILARLRYLSDYYTATRQRFQFARDPNDEVFLELAVASKATHLVTHDRDLLSLERSHASVARRLRRFCPRLRLLTASDFLQSIGWMAN